MRKVQHIDKRIAYNDKKRRHYPKYGTLSVIIIVGYIMTNVTHLMAKYIVRMCNNQSITYN